MLHQTEVPSEQLRMQPSSAEPNSQEALPLQPLTSSQERSPAATAASAERLSTDTNMADPTIMAKQRANMAVTCFFMLICPFVV